MPRKPVSEREKLSWKKEEIIKKLAEKSKINAQDKRQYAFDFIRMLHIALVHDTTLPEDSIQRIFKGDELTDGDYKDKDFQCQMILDTKVTTCTIKQVKGMEPADDMKDVLVEVTCVTELHGEFKIRNRFKNLSGQLDGLKKLDKKWRELVKISKNTEYAEPVITNPEEVKNAIEDRVILKVKVTADRPRSHSLHELIPLLNKAIAGLDRTAIARKKLEDAFIDAARFCYKNKPTTKRDRPDETSSNKEPELTDSDFQPLYVAAIKAFDCLLAWRDLYQIEPPKGGKLCGEEKKCKFCPKYKTQCRREGDERKYKTAVKASDGPPCKVKQVIYMFFCSKCDRRYVGKTENSVAERYSKGPDSVLDGKHNTRSKACTSGEHDLQWTILQVVDETNLTRYNPIFKGCLTTLGSDFKLEGVEQLWIQKLATNPNTDFNTVRSHNYTKRKGGKELLKSIGAKVA